MITLTMGLDLGKVQPDTPIFCENKSWPRPGRPPIHDVHGYGVLTAAQVLIKSSNIGIAKSSLMCGPRALYDYLKRFGMGERTGIEIPAESPGLLRHFECKDRNDRWCWSENSHEYIAFGHEIGATAIQLARAVAVIANGGLLVQPRLVQRQGGVEFSTEGGEIGRRGCRMTFVTLQADLAISRASRKS
jgi:cell division protein FtsI (penicillin-binding protein 3)